jgi:hypothetical protein
VAIFVIAFAVFGRAFLGLASGLLLGRRGLLGGCRARLGAPPRAGCVDCLTGAKPETPRDTNPKQRSEAP